MKFLVVFTCAVAAASAGLLPVGPLVVGGPQHLPVIGPNGVPIDEPAVQQARAAHLVHKVEAHARNGDLSVVAHASPIVAHAAPIAYAQHGISSSLLSGHLAAAPIVVGGPQHLPVIGPNGVPVDEPAVQQARAAHLVHKVEAHARNGDVSVVAHAAPIAYAQHGISSSLLTGHLAHHSLAAPIHHLLRRGILAHATSPIAYAQHGISSSLLTGHLAAAPIVVAGPQHLPVIGPNGVPVDEPAVQHARAAHLAHKVEAHARNGDLAVVAHAAAPVIAHAAPVALAAHGIHGIHAGHAIPAAYPTTLGLPAVTSNGVPLETPEVVAAKSNHFAAHAEALSRNSPIISHGIIAHAAPLVHSW